MTANRIDDRPERTLRERLGSMVVPDVLPASVTDDAIIEVVRALMIESAGVRAKELLFGNQAQLSSLADQQTGLRWQPIETAPKTNWPVLLFVPNYGVTIGSRLSNDQWCYSDREDMPPTHWMPFPDPPVDGLGTPAASPANSQEQDADARIARIRKSLIRAESEGVWDISINQVRWLLDRVDQSRPRDEDETHAFDNGSGMTEVLTVPEMIAEIQRLGRRCEALVAASPAPEVK